jgi:hypothetical protein
MTTWRKLTNASVEMRSIIAVGCPLYRECRTGPLMKPDR